MQRLIYRSKASENVGASDVLKIVESSVHRNRDRAITGFLIYHADRFLQVLEGSSLYLDILMHEIELDPRHSEIEILIQEKVTERWFPDWRLQPLISFSEDRVFEEMCEILQGKAGGSRWYELVMDFLDR